MSLSQDDAAVVQSMRRSAAAADAAAARYRKAGRHDDADKAAKQASRWRQSATAAPTVFAEADQAAACAAYSAREEL